MHFFSTGVCEQNAPRHKERYIAICVPMRILWVGTHIAIYGSLWRWSLFSQTPVGNCGCLGYLLEHTRLYAESSVQLFIRAVCIELVGKSAVCCTLGLAGGLNRYPRAIFIRRMTNGAALKYAVFVLGPPP